MTDDEERLAEALAVQRQHGGNARTHIAERIGALAQAGDAAGVDRWKAIAGALDELLRASRQ
jgi:hypothetical protein